MLTCAHIEQRLVPNPQRFEGLEEDKITWFSNLFLYLEANRNGLEEDKITWHSNYYHTKTSPLHGLEEKEIAVTQTLENHECAGLEEDKIAGYSNLLLRCKDKEIAGHSNQRCRRFCFVIIIPYPDRKANICSIRLRAEKGEV